MNLRSSYYVCAYGEMIRFTHDKFETDIAAGNYCFGAGVSNRITCLRIKKSDTKTGAARKNILEKLRELHLNKTGNVIVV